MRLLLLLLPLLVLLCVFWFFWGRDRRQADRDPGQGPVPPPATRGGTEAMVVCAYCGIHLPRSESIMGKEGFYCCDEHRQMHGP